MPDEPCDLYDASKFICFRHQLQIPPPIAIVACSGARSGARAAGSSSRCGSVDLIRGWHCIFDVYALRRVPQWPGFGHLVRCGGKQLEELG